MASQSGGAPPSWDFLFHQSGMIGSAILFGNASCKKAMTQFPPQSLRGEVAVSFVGPLEPPPLQQHQTRYSDDALAGEGLEANERARQLAAKRAVKGIAKQPPPPQQHQMSCSDDALTGEGLDANERAWQLGDLVAQWCPNRDVAAVSPVIVVNEVAMPPPDQDGEDAIAADRVVARRPGDATSAGEAEREDAEVRAVKDARFISAFSPDDIPGAEQSSACMDVAALQSQLEQLQDATKRSIAAEVESAIEGGACLVDEAGRDRILEICRGIRQSATKLSHHQRQKKLQRELQKAALGQQDWQSEANDAQVLSELVCPRDAKPLSLWDWQVWSQARPTLWRYGDAGNLDPKRTDAPLLAHEWITAMCIREEMEYALEDDAVTFWVCREDQELEVNRFGGGWITLHLFATLFWLTELHQSAYEAQR